MNEPFGPQFYQWWAGLNPVFRYGIGAIVLVVSTILWWFQVADPMFWGPLAAVGAILLLLAGGRDD